MGPVHAFQWYDSLIFIIMLLISTSIGVYYGCFGTKQATPGEYLMGNRKMKKLPIAISVAVSHFSAITLLGVPSDVYKYGASYWWTCMSLVLIVLATLYIYLPVFFNLELVNTYEYLERRFDRKTKLLASSLYVLDETLFSSIVAYSPCLALSAVTGVDIHIVALATCAVCIFYTSIGGMKTVVWTDFFQLAVILATLTATCVIGTRSVGGFSSVWNNAAEGERLDIFDFDLDPTKRDTFWIIFIGYSVSHTSFIALRQSGVQKFLTLPTFRDCVWSVIYFAISLALVTTFCVYIGLLMYAKYVNCDPVLDHKITKPDQMVPYYIMDVAKNIPGASGLFIATIYCASLSSLSSNLNAMSGVLYHDFIKRLVKRDITDETVTKILKMTVVICGIVCTSLVLLVQHLGGIISLTVSLAGMVAGPVMGMFTLGMLFPKANAKGAFFGAISGFIIIAGIVIPSKYQRFIYPTKPVSMDNCSGSLLQAVANLTTTVQPKTDLVSQKPFYLFRISYFYHFTIATVLTIILGLIISYLTNKNERRPNKTLLSPVIHFLLSEESESNGRVLQSLMNGENPVN
ncbi:sodium-coupled monocarboxylate transporter 1-like [Tenebrio molitor]|uniref:sodium-coupled monocarboxylate transporter 1-like n=1 Tax=Tenebrio molitor TaxID=7067 RepID=UPI0036247C1B